MGVLYDAVKIGGGVGGKLIKFGAKLLGGRKRRLARRAKRRAKKAAAAAEKLRATQELQANLFGGTGGSQSMGADQVSAAGNALAAIKEQLGEDEDVKGTSVSNDRREGGMKFNPMWIVYAVGAYVAAKALKIIK